MTRPPTITGVVLSAVLALSPALLGRPDPASPLIPAVSHVLGHKPDVKPPKPPKAQKPPKAPKPNHLKHPKPLKHPRPRQHPKPPKPPRPPHGPSGGPPNPPTPPAGSVGDPPVGAGAASSTSVVGRSAASVLGLRLGTSTAGVATTGMRPPAASPAPVTRHRDGPDLVAAGAASSVLLRGSDDLVGPTMLAVGLGAAMIALAGTLVWGRRRG